MSESSFVLVDSDAAFRAGVEEAAPGYGLAVAARDTAEEAFAACRTLLPSCVVTGLRLPDHDGSWLVSSIRALPPPYGSIPIILVTREIDVETRLTLLRSGIDLLLDKPIRPAELLAQVRAVLQMAERLRDNGAISSMLKRAAADESPSSASPDAPFYGALDAMPTATVLTILELDRRTGILTFTGTKGRAPLILQLASGFVIEGHFGGRTLPPRDAIAEAVLRKQGRFEFNASPPRPAPPGIPAATRLLFLVLDDSPPSESADTIADPAPPPARASQPGAPPGPRAPPQRRTTLMSSPAVQAPAGEGRRSSPELLVRTEDAPPRAPDTKGDGGDQR